MNVEENRLDDHLSFSPRVLIVPIFFLIFHTRYSKKKRHQNASCRGKFRKNAYFISSSTSAAFLPPDGNRVRACSPYFCLVRKCTGGNEFSTRGRERSRVNVNAFVWASRHGGRYHRHGSDGDPRGDDNKLRPRFPRFDERNSLIFTVAN